MLGAIVGIELALSALVGKWKVTQNRSVADRAGVAEGLVRERGDGRARRTSAVTWRRRLTRARRRCAACPRSLAMPIERRARRGRPAAGFLCAILWLAASALPATAGAAPFEDTIAQRVLACTGCHGREGRAGPDGYYPRIAGKPAGYLFNQLRNFRDERRHYELMNGLLALLDDAYLQEIADYFAVARPALPGAARADRARRRCATPAQRSFGAATRARGCRRATTATARR